MKSTKITSRKEVIYRISGFFPKEIGKSLESQKKSQQIVNYYLNLYPEQMFV